VRSCVSEAFRVLTVTTVLASALPARATLSLEGRCLSSKTKEAGATVDCREQCDSRGVAVGAGRDVACISRCRTQFSLKWNRIEGIGGCATIGDGIGIDTKVDGHLAELESALRLGAPSRCTAATYKASGKKALCRFKCHSKAQRRGVVVVDDLCLRRCTGTFALKCAAALTSADCLAAADCATLGAEIDDFVDDVAAQLSTAPTTSTSTLDPTTSTSTLDPTTSTSTLSPTTSTTTTTLDMSQLCPADPSVCPVGPSKTVIGCSAETPCSVWLFGDSNTAGMVNTLGAIALSHPEYSVASFAANPEFASNGPARADELLLTQEAPDIVVVTLGTADLIGLVGQYSGDMLVPDAPTSTELDAIYAQLVSTCDIFVEHGSQCLMGISPGALYTLHPLDIDSPGTEVGFPGPAHTNASLHYLDAGVGELGARIEAAYASTIVNFRTPQNPEYWRNGNLGYFHLSSLGYGRMAHQLEEALQYVIVD
jgi:lysophospholipase L1-like esterase